MKERQEEDEWDWTDTTLPYLPYEWNPVNESRSISLFILFPLFKEVK